MAFDLSDVDLDPVEQFISSAAAMFRFSIDFPDPEPSQDSNEVGRSSELSRMVSVCVLAT